MLTKRLILAASMTFLAITWGVAPSPSQAPGYYGTPDDSSAATIRRMCLKLFGKNWDRPAPLPTVEHLVGADPFFVVLTDFHAGYQGQKFGPQIFMLDHSRQKAAIRQINALQPSFAVHLGDNTWTWGTWPLERYAPVARHALELLGKLRCKLYNCAGTHDFSHHHIPREFDPRFAEQLNARREKFRKFFGDDLYSFEAGGCRFIVFNDALLNTGQPISEEVMEWLESEVAKASRAKVTFVMSHEALFMRAPDEEGGLKNRKAIPEPARSLLLEMFARHGVDVVYSGHNHFQFANQYRDIWMHTLNSVFLNRGEWLTIEGTAGFFPNSAQRHDPYKLGFLVVRVRDGKVHESWVPTYWQVEDPPRQLAQLSGPRLIGRPASEVQDSVLGIAASPPRPFSWRAPQNHWIGPGSVIIDGVVDHWWRLAEKVGSKWLQVWPMPSSATEWANLERGLTLGRPRGVRIAVPLPADVVGMGTAWAKLRPHAKAISAVVVSNGGPTLKSTDSNPQLTTWKPEGSEEKWAQACARAKRLIPASTKVVLGRIPLRRLDVAGFMPKSGSGLEQIRKTAEALEGNADAMAVWMKTQGPPEEFYDDIVRAAKIARANGLELWLDAVGWEYVDEPLRSAYFLRLLAICQATQVRLFWWNGPAHEAGLLDKYYDPTPMFYAAQAWQAMVDGPEKPISIEEEAGILKLRWRNPVSGEYVIWWKPANEINVDVAGNRLAVSSSAMVADPLHARLLKLNSSARLPLCSWPLIARQE